MSESANQLTIYSNSAHMVTQDLGDKGSISVPRSIDVSSIIALDAEGKAIPVHFVVRPKESLNEALNNPKYHLGVIVTKGDRQVKGVIRELNDNNVAVKGADDSSITIIRNYDHITIENPPSIVTKEISSIVFGGSPASISYLFSDVSWICVGTAIINGDNMQLHLAGHITNNTETPVDADVSLISGTVQQRRREPRYFAGTVISYKESAAPSPGPRQTVSINALEEYVKYKLGQVTIQKQALIPLVVLAIPVTKIYHHQIGQEDVYFGYTFEAPDYVPQCLVNAYAGDSQSGIGAFLGSSSIEEHQKGQEIDFILGQTTKVQVESEILPISDIVVTQEVITEQHLELDEDEQRIIRRTPTEQKLHLITEEVGVDISNYNESHAFLCLKYDLRGRRLINTTCRPANKQESGVLEWYFQLDPGTKDSFIKPNKMRFDCTITALGYY